MDHFFQIEMIGKVDEPMLEGYAALDFLAALPRKEIIPAAVEF